MTPLYRKCIFKKSTLIQYQIILKGICSIYIFSDSASLYPVNLASYQIFSFYHCDWKKWCFVVWINILNMFIIICISFSVKHYFVHLLSILSTLLVLIDFNWTIAKELLFLINFNNWIKFHILLFIYYSTNNRLSSFQVFAILKYLMLNNLIVILLLLFLDNKFLGKITWIFEEIYI